MKYGTAPVEIGVQEVRCLELMFFHDYPIKLPSQQSPTVEPRLKPFEGVIGRACCDYIGIRGINSYIASHIYLCAKRLYQSPGCPFNRPGWHTDGFGSEDINYAWCDKTPTVFNIAPMDLPGDDVESMAAMERQALPENDTTYRDGMLLRLDQYVVHRVGDIQEPSIRTFCKVTFSKDRFDLAGNSHNYMLDYCWPMRPRAIARNAPQVLPT